MKLNNRRGFTLIEVIVVAAIIAILAGILVPMIFNQIDEAKISKATGEADSIAKAMMVFQKDNGSWLNKMADGSAASFATGRGNAPSSFSGGWDTNKDAGLGQLSTAPTEYDTGTVDADGNPIMKSVYPGKWKGPYVPIVNPDPWGNQYVVNVADFATASPVWVLSAGPDGKIDTATTNNKIAGDDIGVRIK